MPALNFNDDAYFGSDAEATDLENDRLARVANLTGNERLVLNSLRTNFFGQGVGDWIWSDCINDAHRPSGIEGKALSGVCASLAKKGLIVSDGYGKDRCVALTTQGCKLTRAIWC